MSIWVASSISMAVAWDSSVIVRKGKNTCGNLAYLWKHSISPLDWQTAAVFVSGLSVGRGVCYRWVYADGLQKRFLKMVLWPFMLDCIWPRDECISCLSWGNWTWDNRSFSKWKYIPEQQHINEFTLYPLWKPSSLWGTSWMRRCRKTHVGDFEGQLVSHALFILQQASLERGHRSLNWNLTPMGCRIPWEIAPS